MSEYDFNKKDVTKKSNASDSMSAFSSTNSVSGASSSNSAGRSDVADTCNASNSTADKFSAFGDVMSAYGGSAGPQNVNFSSSKGASSSFNMSSGTSSSNSAGDSGTCSSLQGVQCEAANCHYHHPGGQCSAKSIVVQAPDAGSKSETFCNTFKPNAGY